MDETRLLADTLATARYVDFSPAIVDHARRAVLDWLGSALAGSFEPPARMACKVVAGLGASCESSILPRGRASAAAAALANGVASHILEFDDVHKGSTLHAGAPVIPAALAIGERENSTGADFLAAVVVGYEAALRIGEAVNPSHYHYFHPTGTAATFGSAAAAGHLLKLNGRQMLDALGTAGTQAAGLWEFNTDGAMSKHLHPGKAAFNGILAADLAREGFTGATRILEGDRGFFRAMSAAFDASRITDRLGHYWKIAENCFKMHSCCAHTHTAIDVAQNMGQAFSPDRIESVHIRTYGPGYEIVRNHNPATPYQAKFSLAYCVAAALTEGRAGLAQFSPVRFADLLPRIHMEVAPELTAMYPEAWPVRMEIRLSDGTTLTGGADYPRGNPENPASTAELEDKFRSLVEPHCGANVASRLIEEVRNLESASDMAVVFPVVFPDFK
jgi:2-methylcitrate dehydratase PrpD